MIVLRPGLWAALSFTVVQVVISSELNLPRQTFVAEDYFVDGFSPMPTSQPVARDIFKRLNPALCGYYNGVAQTCSAGYICATNSLYRAAGCCYTTALELSQCTLATTCINYNVLSDCNSACDNNPFIWKCNNVINPWCRTEIWNYPTPFTNVGCGTVSGATYTLDPNPDFLSSTTAPGGGGTTIVTIENVSVGNPTTASVVQTVSVSAAPSQQQTAGTQGNGNGNSNNGGTEIAGNPGAIIEVNPKGNAAGLRACGTQRMFDMDVIFFLSVIIYMTWF